MPKKTFRRDKCAPKGRGTKSLPYTCYNNQDLQKLKEEWNTNNPTNTITTPDSRGIWKSLQEKNNGCQSESCWARNNKTLTNRVFAPKMPRSWKKNINEWLSNDDIEKVLDQYESKYPEFKFIGPSPTDYFVKEYGNVCVWEELCKFDLKDLINQGKTKIGVVFNLDPHYKSGSHWVALFINTDSRYIYFFDSTGARIHKYINRFRKEVQAQAWSQLNQRYEFDSNYKVEHQFHNTECGMYALFFIITMLLHDKDYVDNSIPEKIGKQLKTTIKLRQSGGSFTLFQSVFKNRYLKFPDHLMEKLRNVYFNE
jgi:hypothetical protein